MVVDVPTKIIPIWFIEQWKRENAESGSALDVFIETMIKDWELEEFKQLEVSKRKRYENNGNIRT